MNEIDEFDILLSEKIKKAIPKVLQWATVTSVDWQEKTCEATDLDTKLPFLNIALGIGGMYIKPKVGSLILVGMVENNEISIKILFSGYFCYFIYTAYLLRILLV